MTLIRYELQHCCNCLTTSIFSFYFRKGEDTELSRHMDQSAITFNICLGGVFGNAEVTFDFERDDPLLTRSLATIIEEGEGSTGSTPPSGSNDRRREHPKASVSHRVGRY